MAKKPTTAKKEAPAPMKGGKGAAKPAYGKGKK